MSDMAKLGDKTYTRQALLKYSGNISQLASIEEFAFESGKRRGMRAFRVKNAAGLQFDVVPDLCMDISSLSYRGVNVSWQSKTGYGSGAYAAPVLGEFDRYFGGGMLWTCGLKNTGGDYINADGLFQHAHGRLGVTPSENVYARSYWDGDEYVLSMGGEARDAVLCGHSLNLRRSLKTSLSEACIELEDILVNDEPTATDYVILYHFNFGFPFISPQTRFILPEAAKPIRARTPAAEQGLAQWDTLVAPVDEDEEQVFFHHLKPDGDGRCTIRVENPLCGIGAYLQYEMENLPILTFWKSVRSGEYVVGIEPGNSYIGGMDDARATGILGHIDGFGQKAFRIKLGFYELR